MFNYKTITLVAVIGILCVILFCPISSAMKLEQPVKVGRIIGANMGGFVFENATSNNGTLSKYGGGKAYGTGIARFGDGEDALYFHYRFGDSQENISAIMLFGGDDKRNTIPINIMITNILKITSSNGITFYMIEDGYDLIEEISYTLIGRRPDGTWVKYFDTTTVGKNYFGSGNDNDRNNFWGLAFYKTEIKNGTIIIHYYRNKDRRPIERNVDERGEFRFKWDDKAQWFGIEKVVY